MAINLEGIVTWLKGWFYDKTEITGFLNNKANQSDLNTTNGNVTSLQSNKADKVGGVQQITDNNAHSHIGTIANSTQGEINTAIDTAIGNLQSIKAIEVVSTLDDPVTEANMGKLYIISENSKINVYYAVRSGTSPNYSYSWHKMDADILDELSIDWSDIDNNPFSNSTPSSFAPSSHSHSASDVSDANAHSHIVTSENANQQVINSAIDNNIGYIYNSLNNKAPNSHATILTTYGVGTSSAYGHNKVINNLTTSSHLDGTSLSAYQGYVLKGLIDDLEGDVITSIVLVPKSTDENGKIIFYTGDEP